jgi:phosphoglycerate dehydrogenase-like enzyme
LVPKPGPVLTFLYPVALTDGVRERLSAAAPGVELHVVPYREDMALRNARSRGSVTAQQLASAPGLSDSDWAVLERTTVALVLDIPDTMLDRAGSLQWVQAIAAGIEHLDAHDLAERGVILTNGAGIAAVPIAEFVMGRLLQVWKHSRVLEQRQSEHRWEPVFGHLVAGRTLGIVGLGAIGRATARRARAFDMQVLANRRRASPGDTDPDVDRLFSTGQLDEMTGSCDAVVIAAPAGPETERLFDKERIGAMKPGAILCNVARGSLVDEQALLEALTSGHLSAAILDVTAQEPTPADSPLWSAPNCYLSPHSAAAADHFEDSVVDLLVRNLARFVRGEPLENVVNQS